MTGMCRGIFLLFPLMISTVRYTNAVFALNHQNRGGIVNVINISKYSEISIIKSYLHRNINVGI